MYFPEICLFVCVFVYLFLLCNKLQAYLLVSGYRLKPGAAEFSIKQLLVNHFSIKGFSSGS